MKRSKYIIVVGLLLVVLLMPLTSSLAEDRGSFTESIYIFAYGTKATVKATLHSDSDLEWTLKTIQGQVLCTETLPSINGTVSFSFLVSDDIPPYTTLQLCHPGEEKVQCEAKLFCDSSQNNGIRRVASDKRVMAITFDTANGLSQTMKILDLLDKYQVKATFFLIGNFIKANPEEAAQIVARGHEVDSHSMEHRDMLTASAAQAYTSLYEADKIIRTINGDQLVLYRPPRGLSTFRDRAIAHGLGTEVILWSVDSRDGFSNSTLSDIQYRTTLGLYTGGILLMHVYGRHTLEALDWMLPYYQEMGFTFVTVSQLLLDKDSSYVDFAGSQRPLAHDPSLFGAAFQDALRQDAGQGY